jgi:hypothetical protein
MWENPVVQPIRLWLSVDVLSCHLLSYRAILHFQIVFFLGACASLSTTTRLESLLAMLEMGGGNALGGFARRGAGDFAEPLWPQPASKRLG